MKLLEWVKTQAKERKLEKVKKTARDCYLEKTARSTAFQSLEAFCK